MDGTDRDGIGREITTVSRGDGTADGLLLDSHQRRTNHTTTGSRIAIPRTKRSGNQAMDKGVVTSGRDGGDTVTFDEKFPFPAKSSAGQSGTEIFKARAKGLEERTPLVDTGGVAGEVLPTADSHNTPTV